MLNMDRPRPQAVSNLQNWLAGNPNIVGAETAYLSRGPELLSVAPCDDEPFSRLEAWVEANLIRLWRGIRKVQLNSLPLCLPWGEASRARITDDTIVSFLQRDLERRERLRILEYSV